MLFLDGHRYTVRSLAWSPQGSVLASGGDDHTVRLWRVIPTELLHTFHGHASSVYAVGFWPEGETLISAGRDGEVRLWSVSQGIMRTTPRVHGRSVNCLAIHPRAGVATGDGAWRTTSQAVVRRPSGRLRPAPGLSLRREGPTLILQGQEISCLAFSPDGQTLAVGTPWMLFLWSPRREPAQTVKFGAATAGARPPMEATYSGDLTLGAEGAWFRSVSYSPEGQYFAAAADHQVRVWECGGPLHWVRDGHQATVNAVAFSPMGGLLASAGDDGAVRLWSVSTGSERVSFVWEIGTVHSLAFAPDGLALAAGGQGRIVVWDVEEYY